MPIKALATQYKGGHGKFLRTLLERPYAYFKQPKKRLRVNSAGTDSEVVTHPPRALRVESADALDPHRELVVDVCSALRSCFLRSGTEGGSPPEESLQRLATSIGKLEDEKDIKWPSINGTGITRVVREVSGLRDIPGQQTYSFKKRLEGLYKVFKKIRDRDMTVGSRKGEAGAEASKSPQED